MSKRSSSKWKGRYETGRKYKKEWERQYVWVTESPDGQGTAYCKICKKSMQPKVWSLSKHESSTEHAKRVKEKSTNKTLFVEKTPSAKKKSNLLKQAEIQFAVGIVCHASVAAVDHLGEIACQHGTGSTIGDLHLHRTKCSQLVTKVVSPALKSELKNDVAGKHFSALVDDSTDIATKKNLCICIRYFSEKERTVMTAFLELVEIVHATGESMFNALNDSLSKVGLDFKDCIGFGSDGVSAMVGEWNSVWSRVREVSPHCVLIKCICHSLALCVQHAFEKMPSNLGFMLKEIPKWFSNSVIRREDFKDLIKVMDPNEEEHGKSLPFEKLSATRWLVRGKVLYKILVNWEELKAYFSVTEPSCSSAVRYKARTILNMLKDDINFLYFHFLTPVVSEFERVNAFFQATNGDPDVCLKELCLYYTSLHNRVYNEKKELLPTDKVDFGVKFIQESSNFVGRSENKDAAKEKLREMYSRCQSFLVEAVSQVEKQIPENRKIFEELSNLSPRRVLSQIDRAPFTKLPMQHLMTDISAIEEQYRKIIHVDWATYGAFTNEIPKDPVAFWVGIADYTLSNEEKPFQQLAVYALTCLSTPISNAICERIFSQVTNVKSKLRNRMQNDMLNAIIRIHSTLKFKGICCKDFKASDKMLELFNSDTLYKQEEDAEEPGNRVNISDFVSL